MKKTIFASVLFGFGLASGMTWDGCALTPGTRTAWVVGQDPAQWVPSVYRTTDFGANWQRRWVLTNHVIHDVFFLDDRNGWTCGWLGEVWHTTDAGQTWAWQGYGMAKWTSRVQFLDTSHGWIAAGQALMGRWNSRNHGWETIYLPYPDFSDELTWFQGISFVNTSLGWLCAGVGVSPFGDTFPGGQGYIAMTRDGCANWVRQVRDTVYDYYDIRFFDRDTGVVVGGDDRTTMAYMARTTNGGVSWVGTPSNFAHVLRSMDFVGREHGWAVGDSGTIVQTIDGGRNWYPQTSWVEADLYDVAFADTLHGMASGDGVVLFTTDGGDNWRSSYIAVEEPAAMPVPVSRLTVQPAVARGEVRLNCSFPTHGRARVCVFDVQGRLVRVLFDGRAEAGTVTLTWNGGDSHRRRVRAGTYIVRLETAGACEQRSVVLLSP